MIKSLVALCITAVVLVSCSPTSQQASAGSSSETVIGKIINADGSPAQKTRVILVPADYNPGLQSQPGGRTLFIDSTDEIGAYHVQVSDTGEFNLLAVQSVLGTRCMVRGIGLTGLYPDSFHVKQCTLAVPGAIKVVLTLGLDTINGYVFLPGTTIMASLAHNLGFVILDSVPAGIVPAIFYGAGSAAPTRIVDSIAVLPGDTDRKSVV